MPFLCPCDADRPSCTPTLAMFAAKTSSTCPWASVSTAARDVALRWPRLRCRGSRRTAALADAALLRSRHHHLRRPRVPHHLRRRVRHRHQPGAAHGRTVGQLRRQDLGHGQQRRRRVLRRRAVPALSVRRGHRGGSLGCVCGGARPSIFACRMRRATSQLTMNAHSGAAASSYRSRIVCCSCHSWRRWH